MSETKNTDEQSKSINKLGQFFLKAGKALMKVELRDQVGGLRVVLLKRDVLLLLGDVLQLKFMHFLPFLYSHLQSLIRIVQKGIIFIRIISNIFEFHQFHIRKVLFLLLTIFAFFHFQQNFLIYLHYSMAGIGDSVNNTSYFLIFLLLPVHYIFNEMVPKVKFLVCLLLLPYLHSRVHLFFYISIMPTFHQLNLILESLLKFSDAFNRILKLPLESGKEEVGGRVEVVLQFLGDQTSISDFIRRLH